MGLRVKTGRLTQHVAVSGPLDGPALLLIHGNCSSSAYWDPLRRHLPADWRVAAADLRGYGQSDPAPLDATRGVREFAEDVAELLDVPDLFPPGTRPVVVAHSLGGGVAMQLLTDHPDRISTLVLEAPVSPYGFGGTRDMAGTLTTADFAGTGAGMVNPEFVKRLAAKDRSADDPASPRNVMRATYVSDPEAFGADEEAMLDSVLSTVIGEDNYPGDFTASQNWPMVAPGKRGLANALSPKYLNLTGIVDVTPKPPILWIRGDADVIVSDTSLIDPGQLGRLGLMPGWPGEADFPPQPMVGQTRAVLERYAAAGGSYTEMVYPGIGHSPHIERAAEFAALLEEWVRGGR
jgi:pimeloyl-ACP methyl ester carboxylesterase